MTADLFVGVWAFWTVALLQIGIGVGAMAAIWSLIKAEIRDTRAERSSPADGVPGAAKTCDGTSNGELK
jgi:hypothetical protein